MKILALENRTDKILLDSAVENCTAPIKLIVVHRFIEAINCLRENIPDVLLIGSGVILQEGVDRLIQIKTDERYKALPLIILTEFINEEKHLFEENFCNTCFIARPFDFNEMPGMLNRIIEFCEVCKRAISGAQGEWS